MESCRKGKLLLHSRKSAGCHALRSENSEANCGEHAEKGLAQGPGPRPITLLPQERPLPEQYGRRALQGPTETLIEMQLGSAVLPRLV